MSVPQPEDIYVRTKEEGRRRLERPFVEVVSTALAAGFDIVAGIVALALVSAHLAGWTGVDAAHVFGSIAFGVGFVFLVVGRGELFTENFLVPIAGLDRRDRSSWLALARLWTVSPVFNILGGTLIILVLTVHGVLPEGTGTPLVRAAEDFHAHHPLVALPERGVRRRADHGDDVVRRGQRLDGACGSWSPGSRPPSSRSAGSTT